MSYFENLDAPSLGDKVSLRWQLEVGVQFHGRRSPEGTTMRLLSAYLITVDKAVREYEWGREELLLHQKEGGTIPFFNGLGHFENCINAVKRSMRFLNRLKNQRGGPAASRESLRAARAAWRQITDTRDAIEHMDEKIGRSDGPVDKEAHLLCVDNFGGKLEIGRWSITFQLLASTISALHLAGVSMIESLPAPQT